MANIALTNSCNLDCSYCFAKKFRGLPQESNIKFTDFTAAVNWINCTEHPQPIGIIGGEPLLHPLFDDFMELLRMKRRCDDQIIQVFSNGILLDEHVDSIKRANAVVALNINSPEDIGSNLFSKIYDNMSLLRKRDIPFGIGINLYREMDMEFFYDLIKEFGLSSYRIGLSAPNEEGADAFTYYREIEDAYINLIEGGAKLGAAAGIDCFRLPYCFYSKHENRINTLIERTGLNIETGQDCRRCSPVIDITPSLHIARCFGTLRGGLMMPMKAFRNPLEAEEFFKTNIDNIMQLIPMNVECEGCYDKAIGSCQGGCLGFKLEHFMNMQKGLKELVSGPTPTLEIEF